MKKLIQLTLLISIFTNNSQAQTPTMYGLQMTSPGATDYFTFESVNPLNCNRNIINSNLPYPSFNGYITGITGSCNELFYPGYANNSKGILKYNLINGQQSFQNIISSFPTTYPIEFEYNYSNGKLIGFSYNMSNHLYYSEIDLINGNETVLFEISDTVLTGSGGGGGGQFNNYMTFDETNGVIYQLFGFNQLTKYDIANQSFVKLTAQNANNNMYFFYNIFFDEAENAIYGIGYYPTSTYGLLKLNLNTNQFSLVSEIWEDLSDLNYVTYSKLHKLFTLSIRTLTDANYLVTYDVTNGNNTTCNYGELDPPMVYIDCQPLELELKPNENLISISPNPVQNILSINNNTNEEVNFILTDANGKLLINGENISQIDFSNYNSGIYILKAISKENSSTQKIIKE